MLAELGRGQGPANFLQAAIDVVGLTTVALKEELSQGFRPSLLAVSPGWANVPGSRRRFGSTGEGLVRIYMQRVAPKI